MKNIYTFIFTSCNVNNGDKSKIYFFLDSYTLCLCWMHWFMSHLIYYPQCSNVFIQVRNICFTSTSHLFLLDILLVLKVKLVLFYQFTIVHFDLISNIFLLSCKQNSLNETFDMVQSSKLDQTQAKFVKIFSSWFHAYLTAVTSVTVIFLRLTLFANTAAFFNSLLWLVPHSFWEGDSGEETSTQWICLKDINQSHDSWLVFWEAYKLAFHA